MGLLIALLWACVPAPADPGEAVTAECEQWPVQVGDVSLFGGPAADITAAVPPGDWDIDIVREITVQEGLVQRTSIDGRAMWADFKGGAGLSMEAFWSEDGAFDVTYDEPLELYRYPLEGSWTSTASFSNGIVLYTPNQGVDTWSAEVVDTIDLELDGIVFVDTAVIEVVVTRELAVSTGPIEWRETAWVQPCVGMLARISDGRGMRLLP